MGEIDSNGGISYSQARGRPTMKGGISPGQKRVRDRILRSASGWKDRSVSPDAFDRAGWRTCAELGIHGLPVPRRWGGQGLNPPAVVDALEALGYACPDRGLLFSIGAHLWGAVHPLSTFGSDRQKARLRDLCAGRSIGAHGVTESEAGSDALSMKTRATRRGSRWILSGRKRFVTNSPIADLFVVYARTEGGGLSAFLVDRRTRGVGVEKRDFMGLSSAPIGELVLRRCDLPADALLGRLGAGETMFQQSMEWERACIMAPAVGSMARLLERCHERARERRQFGRPIGEFQFVSGRLADMRLRVETSRALLRAFARRKADGRSAMAESAMAKLHIGEAWIQSCQDAMQIFGGSGYLTETGLERELRDALGSRAYSGTPDIQRAIIARMGPADPP